MLSKAKKHTILGGVKVSSSQLSEWGKAGGRPQKYSSNAERQRAYKLRKKQEKFGVKAQLEGRKTYEQVQISKYLTCPKCGKVEKDLGKYFNKQGEYIRESYWFDSVRMEKINVKENKFYCQKCYQYFSLKDGEVKIKETKNIIKKAGSIKERVRRFREKGKKS